jgi:hypothetical protein
MRSSCAARAPRDAFDLVLRVRVDLEEVSVERHVRDVAVLAAHDGRAAVRAAARVLHTVLRAHRDFDAPVSERRAHVVVVLFGVGLGDGRAERESNQIEDAALAGAAAADDAIEAIAEVEANVAEVGAAGDGDREHGVM